MSLPPDVRLVAVSVDFLGQLGTRTNQGWLITAEWGEPDENGRYTPTFTATDDGMVLVPREELESARKATDKAHKALGSFVWLGNNLPNSGTETFRDLYRAALGDVVIAYEATAPRSSEEPS